MGDNPTNENGDDSGVDVNLSESSAEDDGEFEHPDDVPTTDASEIPEVNSAEDAVDGDEDRMERLKQKAKEMEDETYPAGGEPEDADGTPVNLGDDVPEKASVDEDVGEAPDAVGADGGTDTVQQAGDSIFTDEEAEQVEEQFGDQFDLETLDDVPDDFDYESQDTSHYGAEEEADIKHNGVIFHLEQPSGTREDKFWSEIQQKTSLAGMFDTLIKYGVTRPEDIEERMEHENWTGFAKAGLAMKVSSFLGLDSLQDF